MSVNDSGIVLGEHTTQRVVSKLGEYYGNAIKLLVLVVLVSVTHSAAMEKNDVKRFHLSIRDHTYSCRILAILAGDDDNEDDKKNDNDNASECE